MAWAMSSLRQRWSIRIVKGCPRRYWHHFLTAVVIAANSLTYVDAQRRVGQNNLLKKAIG